MSTIQGSKTDPTPLLLSHCRSAGSDTRRLRLALRSCYTCAITTLALQLVALNLSCVQAPDGKSLDSLSARQLQSEIRRLNNEIDKLRNSPKAPEGWKELQTVEAKIEELRIRAVQLSGSGNIPQWKQQIYELEKQLDAVTDEEARVTRDAGVRLFQTRHAELEKQAPQTPKLHELGFDVLNYPRIDGSTSTRPLAVLITCKYFDAPSAWIGTGQIRPRARTDTMESLFPVHPEPEAVLMEFTLRAKAGGATSERLAVMINDLLATNASTHQAYINLIEGRSDIGLLARLPSSDELEFARKKNVDLETTPCALDAFVFLVNRDNPVRNLTSQQIREIYSGKVKSWDSLGGAGYIVPYQREENSGSQQLMKSLVMKNVPLYAEATIHPLIGQVMSDTFLWLTSDEKGIGYSVYYYEHFMSGSPRTQMIAVDGIEPNPETIATRKYPYVSEVFVVTRKGLPISSPTAKLRAWLLSPEGQSVVLASGYVPLSSGR